MEATQPQGHSSWMPSSYAFYLWSSKDCENLNESSS